MPYEVESQTTRVGGQVFNTSQGGRGGRCNPVQCAMVSMCVCMLAGLALIGMGASSLGAAMVDTRGQKIATFGAALDSWNAGGQAAYTASSGINTMSVGSNTMTLSQSTSTVTPSNYGESEFGDEKTSVSAQAYTHVEYTGNLLPNGNWDGSTVQISLGADQSSPTQSAKTYSTRSWSTSKTHLERSAYGGTSWWQGEGGCVDDTFLYTADGGGHYCPNELVSTYTGMSAYQNWAGFVTYYNTYSTAHRFLWYRSASGLERCWDTLDCTCVVSGTACNYQTSAAQPTTTIANWIAPLSRGFTYSPQNGDVDMNCGSQVWACANYEPVSTATKICYVAAGPFYRGNGVTSGDRCSSRCASQGGAWTNGNIGLAAFQARDGEQGFCTIKSYLTDVCALADADGTISSTPCPGRSTVGVMTARMSAPSAISLKTMSAADPSVVGATVTGCDSLVTNAPGSCDKAFGNTQAENATNGIMYLGIGIALFLIPCCICAGLMACMCGWIRMWK